jgi:hypothetical protein
MSLQKYSFVSLDSCINDYLTESEQGIHKYFKCFNLAFRAMDELGIDFFYQVKTFALPVNANKTANIPSNCIRYTKIGVLNSKGEIIPLYHKPDLTSYADLFPNRVAKLQELAPANLVNPLNLSPNAFNNYWTDNTFMTLYGLPSGAPFIGGFKIDEENGVIILSTNYQYDYVILECVISPREDEDYFVPMQFREAIISYLSWKDIKSLPATRRGGLVDKRDRRHDYYNERRMAIARYKPFRPQEAHQLNMEQTRLTVKI